MTSSSSTTTVESGDRNKSEDDVKEKKEILKEAQALQRNGDADLQVNDQPHFAMGRQERSINFDIVISHHDVKSLIGKGGNNIRRIQKETNTRIIPRGGRKADVINSML